MSERQINDPQSTPQAPASVDASARQLASARRRRFIKLGGAAVPTALTLASRPVMAWNCNTASTWGSAQGVSTGHSSYTRSRVNGTTLFSDETYTVACWVNNTTRSTLAANPWAQSPLTCNVSTPSNSTYYKKYTVAQLLSGMGATIAGISDTSDSVWRILKNDTANYPLKSGNTSTEFTRLMLTAWLNFRVQNAVLNKCLAPTSTNVLVKFGNGSYVGPTGVTWLQADVVKYLKKNYVACADDNCA